MILDDEGESDATARYQIVQARAEERLLDLLIPPITEPPIADEEVARLGVRWERTREKFRMLLRDGKLEDRFVDIEIHDQPAELMRTLSFDDMMRQAVSNRLPGINAEFLHMLQEWLQPLLRRESMTVAEARRYLTEDEFAKLDIPQPIISPATTLIVPEPSQIIVVRQSLLQLLRGKPELLYEISHRQFEELVYELFAKLGYQVELTAQTRDGGADIIAFSQDHLGIRTKYIIEAKHYAPQRRIGVGIVRQVNSVRQKMGAHHGIIVTSSFFTSDAARENREYYGLHLKDHDHLMEWIYRP